MRVLAAIGVVDLLIGAHYRTDTSADSIGEGPKIEFMHGAVIDVTGDGFREDGVVLVAICFGSLTEMFLLVG